MGGVSAVVGQQTVGFLVRGGSHAIEHVFLRVTL
jgi:hypothetical protein